MGRWVDHKLDNRPQQTASGVAVGLLAVGWHGSGRKGRRIVPCESGRCGAIRERTCVQLQWMFYLL